MRYNLGMPPTYYGAAANHQKRSGFHLDRRVLLFLGLGIVVILFIGIISTVLGALTGGPKTDLTLLVARQASFSAFLNANYGPVQNDALQKVTAEAAILTASDYRVLNTQLSLTYNVTAIPDSVTAAEADQNAAALKSAQVAGTYDSVFIGLLRDKLAAELSLANTVNQAASGNLKKDTQQVISNITSLGTELATVKL